MTTFLFNCLFVDALLEGWMSIPVGILASCPNMYAQPDWAKIEETSKNHQNWKKKSRRKRLFLHGFSNFVQFKLNLVHQTSMSLLSEYWCFFWHPGGPLGCVHSDDIMVFYICF